jgi:hypothetical protein
MPTEDSALGFERAQAGPICPAWQIRAKLRLPQARPIR